MPEEKEDKVEKPVKKKAVKKSSKLVGAGRFAKKKKAKIKGGRYSN